MIIKELINNKIFKDKESEEGVPLSDLEYYRLCSAINILQNEIDEGKYGTMESAPIGFIYSLRGMSILIKERRSREEFSDEGRSMHDERLSRLGI